LKKETPVSQGGRKEADVKPTLLSLTNNTNNSVQKGFFRRIRNYSILFRRTRRRGRGIGRKKREENSPKFTVNKGREKESHRRKLCRDSPKACGRIGRGHVRSSIVKDQASSSVGEIRIS